jgi:hypothetical protein
MDPGELLTSVTLKSRSNKKINGYYVLYPLLRVDIYLDGDTCTVGHREVIGAHHVSSKLHENPRQYPYEMYL